MIVILTGAYRNVGDHLIGIRAKALLKKYVDSHIINLDRCSIKAKDYSTINKAKMVVLCGGPAYQRNMYPGIYQLNYKNIQVPIIPFGLGWKSNLEDIPSSFTFNSSSLEFIKTIHASIQVSSARDILTQKLLNYLGINNVIMTGCPAWYDLDFLPLNYSHSDQVEQVVVSMPARYHPQIPLLLKYLIQRFPNSKKFATFHHGFWLKSNLANFNLKASSDFLRMYLISAKNGFHSLDLSKNIEKLEIYDVKNSLHVGYRVHAHLYCLSHRKQSFLLCEDIRGVAQAKSLEHPYFCISDEKAISKLDICLNKHFNTGGRQIQDTVQNMNRIFESMIDFLNTISRK